jgi:uncharacterized protein with GYD domain
MPGYICLMKFTHEGISSVKDSPKRMAAIKAATEQMGARVVGVWVTMGRCDLVAVVDAPDDHTAGVLSLMLGSQGNVTTETMRAFSEDEYAELVAKLP